MSAPSEATLTRILDYYDWPMFEARPTGNLRLSEWASIPGGEELVSIPPTYDFYMRVGLHLGRPTQAIFSHGKFLRIRREKRFEGCDLKKIDPNKPDECLYEEFQQAEPQLNLFPGALQGGANWGNIYPTVTSTGLTPLPMYSITSVCSWRPRSQLAGNPHVSAQWLQQYNYQPNQNYLNPYPYTTGVVGGQLTGNFTLAATNIPIPIPIPITVTQTAGGIGTLGGLGYAPQLPRIK
jgi:hypothetical protein